MTARRPDQAQAISAAISASGLDQVTIADKVGASQATVSRWATASSAPKPIYWPAIREVLGLDLSAPVISLHVWRDEADRLQAQIDALEVRLLKQGQQLATLAAANSRRAKPASPRPTGRSH